MAWDEQNDERTLKLSWKLTRRHFIRNAGILAAGVAASSLPAGWMTKAQAQVRPVTFGCSISLTGPLSPGGLALKEGYDFFADWINKNRGGLNVGGQRRPIEIKYLDDESQAERTARLVEKLIVDDRLDLLLGPYTTGNALAAGEIVKRHNKLMIEGGGTSDSILERYGGWIFLTLPSIKLRPSPFSEMVTSLSPRSETVAIVSSKDAYTLDTRDAFFDTFKKTGLRVVVDQTVPMDVLDFTPFISQARSRKADVVILNVHIGSLVPASRQMFELRCEPKATITTVAPFESTSYFQALGGISKYQYNFGLYNRDSKYADPYFGSNRLFVFDFEEATKKRPTGLHMAGVTCLEAFALAIEKVGSTNPDEIRKALFAMNVEGAGGPIKFDSLGRILRPAGVIQRQGKKGETINFVYPSRMAQAPPLYPQPSWKQRQEQGEL